MEETFSADPQLQDSPVTLGQSPQQNAPNGQLTPPADFPTEIPLYPAAKLQAVTPLPTQGAEASQGQLTRWTTDDSSNSVQKFYQDQFKANNWEILPPASTTGEGVSQPAESSDTILARRNDLKVAVSIQSRTSSSSPSGTPSPTPGENSSTATEFTIRYIRETTAGTTPQSSPSSTQSAEGNSTVQPGSAPGDVSKVPQELRQYVEDLLALGVLTSAEGSKSASVGTSSQFEPNKTITHREYARWLVAANNQIYSNSPGKQLRLASETSQPAFQDVPKSDPDYGIIQGLAEAGLIPSPLTGDSTAVLFRPDAPLTREQLILWKVPLDTRQALPSASVDAVKQTWGFQDISKIDPKALRAVLADFQNGDQANIRRVFGYTILFQPKKPVTRSEAAAALWYFGSQGEGISAQEALQLKRQPSQPSPSAEATPSPSTPSQ